jgi:acetyl-CoA C-acetyltransferase
MTEAFIYDAIRTPRGKGKATGSLHNVAPVDLVVGLIHEALARFDQLDPTAIDDVILGCVTPLGDQGADIAKTAALKAGLPETVAGVQLNRFCASGLEAVNTAAQKVASGWEHLLLAGGVESMSRVPMGSDGGPMVDDPETRAAIGWVPQGIGADLIATIEGWSRADVDAFAVESQRRAADAQREGRSDRSLVPVADTSGHIVLDRDEFLRPHTTVESLSTLKPSFAELGAASASGAAGAAGANGGFDVIALRKYPQVQRIDHVHHAGNSSGIVDGASLVVIGSKRAGEILGAEPRGRILATAVSGAEPTIMLTGPAPACRKALQIAGLEPSDIDLVEMNEAFAAAAMRLIRDMRFDPEIVNVNGGAIALGHPLGATGGMLVGTILDELERREQRYGLVTLCAGGGMGIATVIERI